MQRPTQGLFPPNGFKHLDAATGITFSGDSWHDVARKLEGYRRANGMSVGSPLDEVFDRFCREFPHYCHRTDREQVFVEMQNTDHGFGNRVVGWVSSVVSSVHLQQKVSEGEARTRAAICARCPMQRDWTTSCGCNLGQVAQLRNYLLKTHQITETNESRSLRACGTLAEETSLSVWVKQPPVNQGQPENCWRMRS